MELLPIAENEFDTIYDAMEEAFPYEERRDRAVARRLLGEPRYRILHAVSEGVRVGFVTVWELLEYAFVEHFVTYPSYRNRGYGAQVIACLKARYPRIVLEAEHPETQIAARRLAFYGRQGFAANDYPYLQPSYHGESTGVPLVLPLVLMSYPERLTSPSEVVSLLYREVYRVPLEQQAR